MFPLAALNVPVPPLSPPFHSALAFLFGIPIAPFRVNANSKLPQSNHPCGRPAGMARRPNQLLDVFLEPPNAECDEHDRERDERKRVAPHRIDPGALEQNAAQDAEVIRDWKNSTEPLGKCRHGFSRKHEA